MHPMDALRASDLKDFDSFASRPGNVEKSTKSRPEYKNDNGRLSKGCEKVNKKSTGTLTY